MLTICDHHTKWHETLGLQQSMKAGFRERERESLPKVGVNKGCFTLDHKSKIIWELKAMGTGQSVIASGQRWSLHVAM